MKTSGLYDTRPNEFIKIPQGTTFRQMARIFATQQYNWTLGVCPLRGGIILMWFTRIWNF